MDLSIFISKPPILFLYFKVFGFFSPRLFSEYYSGLSDPLGMKTLILSVAGVLLTLTDESLPGISLGHNELFHPKLHPIPRDNLYPLTGWCWGTKA